MPSCSARMFKVIALAGLRKWFVSCRRSQTWKKITVTSSGRQISLGEWLISDVYPLIPLEVLGYSFCNQTGLITCLWYPLYWHMTLVQLVMQITCQKFQISEVSVWQNYSFPRCCLLWTFLHRVGLVISDHWMLHCLVCEGANFGEQRGGCKV